MKKTIHTPIEKTKPKAMWGVLAAVLIAIPLPAQYVNTLISTNLSQPWGVAADPLGNVFVTDSANNRIVEYSPGSGATSVLASGVFSQPLGIAAARGGLVVVDQNNQLIRQVSFTGTVTLVAGVAQSPGANDGAGTNATFSYPVGITGDNAGNLYVADWGNNLIREVDVSNNVSTIQTPGYQFNGPTAVTLDNEGDLWVADTGNNVICMIVLSNGLVTNITSGQFDAPSGVFWDSVGNRLLISDSGNSAIRSLSLTNSSYAVQTIAGSLGQTGNVDGLPDVARFGFPAGICIDIVDSGYYIADFGNNSLRVLQPSAPQPPVSTPQIGYVTFPATANPAYTSVFVPSTGATFNNLTNIIVVGEPGTLTYITFGPTSTSIPLPGPGSVTPPVYPGDGSTRTQVLPAFNRNPGTNDVTVYAIGEASGRRSSAVASARFQFVTGNPMISGDNAADLLLSDVTEDATLYYTIDGSSPTNDGSSGAGVSSGTILSLVITSNVNLQVRAFADGLAASQIVSNQLSISNVFGNQLTWGFATGLASTHFITGLNMSFSAPVTFTELPDSLLIYTMQLDLTLTNNGTNVPPALTSKNFVVHLLQPDPAPPDFKLLPPGIFDPMTDVTNVGITATQPDTLGVVWIVTPPVTNMYTSPNLLEYSGLNETLFTLENNGTLLGELDCLIPSNATPGTPYTLQISHPSASSYNDPFCCGPPIDVFVQAPTNGPTNGPDLNSIKAITVLTNNSPASAHLVGDVFPFSWYNIGDFGDGLLLNDDVIETMEYALQFGGSPYPTNNPYYDAMDSGNGTVNTFYTATDKTIDTITNGDGYIKVDDVYVTLRRSLDSSLVNYTRYWNGSNWVPTVYPNSVQSSAKSSATQPAPSKLALGGPRYIAVAADQVQLGDYLTARVPIRVLAADTLPVRVLMLDVAIQPLDGSPAFTGTATFSPVTNLGAPTLTASIGANDYGAAWLDSTVAGVTGTNIIGTLSVTLPSNVTGNSAYRVHFNHFSASPNGIALFHTTIQDGLITVGDRTGSSWNDGIPDTWRLLYFGTVSNALSAANADPDGDGASNWEEYVAGTNPLDATSVFKFQPATPVSGGAFTLQWPSVVNKSYSLQSSPSMSAGWTTITNLIGNGQTLQWTDTNSASGAKFYRALVQ
jgi:sugar lactone lactonase YvrE